MNTPFYAYCLGISLVLAQIAAICLAIRGTKISKQNAENIDDLKSKTDGQSKTIDEIHATTQVLKEGLKP